MTTAISRNSGRRLNISLSLVPIATKVRPATHICFYTCFSARFCSRTGGKKDINDNRKLFSDKLSMYKLAGRLCFSLTVWRIPFDFAKERTHSSWKTSWMFRALCGKCSSVLLQQQLSFSQSPFAPGVRATTKHVSSAAKRDSFQCLTQMAEHLRCPQIACASGGGSDMEPEYPCWDFVGSD